MESQFCIWVKSICSEHSELVSIDGKSICGAKQRGIGASLNGEKYSIFVEVLKDWMAYIRNRLPISKRFE
jgi:hypothetical protein